jgi:hypothetical protein
MAFKSKYKGFEVEEILDLVSEQVRDVVEIISDTYDSIFNEDFNKDFKI